MREMTCGGRAVPMSNYKFSSLAEVALDTWKNIKGCDFPLAITLLEMYAG